MQILDLTFIQKLDFYFPFLVLFYGFVMTVSLNWPSLARVAEERFPPWLQMQMKSHRVFGILCLFAGALWSLQNIWFVHSA